MITHTKAPKAVGPGYRVALYTRVSTEDQVREGYSLDAQMQRLRGYAAARQWNVVGEYVDEGKTGRNTKRPQYNRMMAQMADWDGMVVLKLDRIHRDQWNFVTMIRELEGHGKTLTSITETVDTTSAMGRFTTNIVALIAQLESEQIGERIDNVLRYREQEPGWFGPAGLGYELVAGNLVVVPDEAKWIRFIFEKFVIARWSIDAIVDALVAAEAPSPRHGRVTGRWTKTTVKQILRNPKFRGARITNRLHREKNHEAIVHADIFEAAQERLRETGERYRRINGHAGA